jgi:hypothetical protein
MEGNGKIQELVLDLETQIKLLKSQVDKLEKTVEKYDADLTGNGGRMGIRTQVAILWRTYVWLLCTVSAFAGSLLTWLVMKQI